MPNFIDKVLGDMPQHLQVYSRRSSVLASNLANADTPGYKARDIDFRTALAGARSEQLALVTTQPGHLGAAGGVTGTPALLYRNPSQPSLDGNTVDAQVERSEFTQNAVRYQSTLQFLSGRFKGMLTAIKGE